MKEFSGCPARTWQSWELRGKLSVLQTTDAGSPQHWQIQYADMQVGVGRSCEPSTEWSSDENSSQAIRAVFAVNPKVHP